MERPERMICLIVGALLDLLEPALWVLAILANVTALQRIVFTRRLTSEPPAVLRAALLAVLLLPALAGAADRRPRCRGGRSRPSWSGRGRGPSPPTRPGIRARWRRSSPPTPPARAGSATT